MLRRPTRVMDFALLRSKTSNDRTVSRKPTVLSHGSHLELGTPDHQNILNTCMDHEMTSYLIREKRTRDTPTGDR